MEKLVLNSCKGGGACTVTATQNGAISQIRVEFYDILFEQPVWKIKFATVHELAHVMDNMSSIGTSKPSDRFPFDPSDPLSVSGSRGSNEHWAEAVALYFYPDFGATLRDLASFEYNFVWRYLSGYGW